MFTTPCFIRKNTPELREKLEHLGYVSKNECIDSCTLKTYTNGKFLQDMFFPECVWEEKDLFAPQDAIDCGTNEALFLALAALRDDSDYMQWFTNADSSCFYFCGTKSWIDSSNISPCYRKATPAEVKEYFNK